MSSLSCEHCVVVGLDEQQAPAWDCQGSAQRKKRKKKIRGLPGRTEVLNKGGFHSWKTPQGPEVNGGIELLA